MNACFVIMLATTISLPEAQKKVEFFETRIRPILVEHCQECHGAKRQEADLRLDHRSFLVKKSARGSAVIPGQPDKSLLVIAVEHRDSS